MAGSVNKVILVGRCGRDPELRFTPAGKAVCNFTMATSETWKDADGEKQERTEWSRIVVWGKLAEIVGKYLAKGGMVAVIGKLATREWTDKEGATRYTTEIIADEVQMLGSKSDSAGEHRESAPADDSGADPFDDIPF